MPANKANGYTIFCDDIRHEVGNKLSFMGVYSTDIVVGAAFPVTLPRLAFHVVLREDVHAAMNPIKLMIYLPGDPDGEATFVTDIPRSSENAAPPPANPPPGMLRLLGLNVVLSPIAIKQPGFIKVRMLIDEEKIRLGAIEVRPAPPITNQTIDITPLGIQP